MSFSDLLIHTITIFNRTAGSTDIYGDDVETFDAGTAVAARVQQDERVTRTKEALIDRDTRETRFLVFLLPSVTVDALSRFVWGTRTMNVEGEPKVLYDRSGPHHIEAQAIEFRG